jgi:hypothetical protein
MRSRTHAATSLLRALLGLVLAVSTTVAASAAAAAPDKEAREARTAWQKGKRALAAGRHQEAEEALCGAMELQPIPQHVIDCARALVAREDWRNAHAVLLPWAEAKDELTAGERHAVRTLWSKVQARTARVRVEVRGERDSAIELQIDGQDVAPDEAAVVSPGPHEARVIVDGGKAVVRRVVARAGAEVVVRIDVGEATRAEPDAGAALRPEVTTDDDDDGGGTIWPGAIALGAGGVAVGLGATFGVLAATSASDVRARCDGNVCPAEVADDARTSAMYGDASTASFVLGGVLALGGVGLLIAFGGDDDEPTTGRSTPRSGTAALFLGPQAGGMRGSF